MTRILSLLADIVEAPRLRRRLDAEAATVAMWAQRYTAEVRHREALEAAVSEAGDALRAANRRLVHAPTPETPIEECWTLGGSDAALAMVMWGRGEIVEIDGVTGSLAPTLADLGKMDAAVIHKAKGCGTEAMRRAARTLALAGVEAHSSWERWMR